MELALEAQDESSGGSSGGSSGESSGASSGASLGVISGESSGGKDILEGGKILVVPVIGIALRNLRIASLSPQATTLSNTFGQTPLFQASSCCMIPLPLTYVAKVASILLPNLYQ